MDALVFEHADGTFARTGECCRCGECCVDDPFEGELGEATVHGMCPLYRLLDDGKGHCSDRVHPYYLNGCNVFPTHPGQIADKPGCSYSFEKVR
jgi:hypothetical protein